MIPIGHPASAPAPAGRAAAHPGGPAKLRAVRRPLPDGLGDFRVVGLNWKTATLEEREAAARIARERPVALPGTEGSATSEAVLLSTCNRLELYAVCPGPLAADPLGRAYFGAFPPDRVYERSGAEAAAHLFSVTAGLESMALGETEIFSQVKEAYSLAVAASGTGQFLNRLFHAAFSVSKQIRTATDIARGHTSYASAAYHLCRRDVPEERPLEVLLLGAGEIATTVAEFFSRQRNVRLTVLSRRLSRAKELADRVGAAGRALTEWPALLPAADVVIGGLMLEAPILTPESLAPCLAGRGPRKLLLVDLSIPRNFSPGCGELPGVGLVNLNDLKGMVERTMERRREAAREAAPLIRAEIEKLETWVRGGSAAAVMNRLSERVRTAAADTLGMQWILGVEMAELKRLHRSLMKMIMHGPRLALERFPPRERPACTERLGRLLCPFPPGIDPEVVDPVFHSETLVCGARERFRVFLDRVGGGTDADRRADDLAADFVRHLFAPLNRVYAVSICTGHRRALERDMALFFPE